MTMAFNRWPRRVRSLTATSPTGERFNVPSSLRSREGVWRKVDANELLMSYLSGKFVAFARFLKTKLLKALLGTESHECGRWAWNLCAYLLFFNGKCIQQRVCLAFWTDSAHNAVKFEALARALLAFLISVWFSTFRKRSPVDWFVEKFFDNFQSNFNWVLYRRVWLNAHWKHWQLFETLISQRAVLKSCPHQSNLCIRTKNL